MKVRFIVASWASCLEWPVARVSVRVLGAVAGVLLVSGALGAQDAVHTFTAEKPGAAPPGFTFGTWRQLGPATWSIRRSGANGYLHHEADSRAKGYALAVASSPTARDLEAAVRLRLPGGGRAGGLIWRYQDDLNYYAAVLDLGRGQVALWRVSSGNRVVLEIEDDLELDVDAWHVLKIRHHESEVRVYLGGIRVFSETDRRGSRESVAGRAGVIAQGDADVWIDDLRIAPATRNGR